MGDTSRDMTAFEITVVRFAHLGGGNLSGIYALHDSLNGAVILHAGDMTKYRRYIC